MTVGEKTRTEKETFLSEDTCPCPRPSLPLVRNTAQHAPPCPHDVLRRLAHHQLHGGVLEDVALARQAGLGRGRRRGRLLGIGREPGLQIRIGVELKISNFFEFSNLHRTLNFRTYCMPNSQKF